MALRGLNSASPLIIRDIYINQGPSTDTYILVDFCSITSLYYSQGTCVTNSGVPIPLDAQFSIRKPTDVNPTVFASTVETQFRDWVGLTTCENGEPGSFKFASPTGGPLTQPSSSSTSSASVRSATEESASSIPTPVIQQNSRRTSTSARPTAKINKEGKVAVSVVVPVVVLISLLAALLFLRRRRKARSRTEQRKDEPSTPDEAKPYLQRKAELEAKDRGKFELEARERRYELDAENMIHEAETENIVQEMEAEDMKDSMPSLPPSRASRQ